MLNLYILFISIAFNEYIKHYNGDVVDGVTGDICPIGSYCPQGSPAPTTCIAGSYTNATGQATCLTCPAGYQCLGGSDINPCPQGQYCPLGTGIATQPCPIGEWYT